MDYGNQIIAVISEVLKIGILASTFLGKKI